MNHNYFREPSKGFKSPFLINFWFCFYFYFFLENCLDQYKIIPNLYEIRDKAPFYIKQEAHAHYRSPGNCSVALAMYMYIRVLYIYRGNKIICTIPGLFNPIIFLNSNNIIKKLQHKIQWHNWINLKYKK